MDCPDTTDWKFTINDTISSVVSPASKSLEWGMNVISSSTYGISSIQMKRNLQDLVSIGGSTAIFVPVHHQKSKFSSNIFKRSNSPSNFALKDAILYAKSAGLKTGIKPHVNLDSGEPRSRMKPENFKLWSANYRKFILDYAHLAEELDVDIFFIGTELEGVSGNELYWRDLVTSVREIYRGNISYSSNRIGEALNIKWWDALDFIGISFYDPLLSKASAHIDEADLVAAWYYRGHVLQLLRLYEMWKIPIVLGEIGYYSRIDTGVNPAVISKGEIDVSAQATAYRAAYKVLSSIPEVKAFYIWALDASSISTPGGYSIIPSNDIVMCELMSHTRNKVISSR